MEEMERTIHPKVAQMALAVEGMTEAELALLEKAVTQERCRRNRQTLK
jgi:hypothetical protein